LTGALQVSRGSPKSTDSGRVG